MRCFCRHCDKLLETYSKVPIKITSCLGLSLALQQVVQQLLPAFVHIAAVADVDGLQGSVVLQAQKAIQVLHLSALTTSHIYIQGMEQCH